MTIYSGGVGEGGGEVQSTVRMGQSIKSDALNTIVSFFLPCPSVAEGIARWSRH